MSYQFEQVDSDNDAAELRRRAWQRMFLLLFLAGTIIAAIGWLAPALRLKELSIIFRYSLFIAIAGHAVQLIALFGSMLTPDRSGEQGEP